MYPLEWSCLPPHQVVEDLRGVVPTTKPLGGNSSVPLRGLGAGERYTEFGRWI